jgi:hypothetical protein
LLDRIFAAGFLTAGDFVTTFLCERPLAAAPLVTFALTLSLFFWLLLVAFAMPLTFFFLEIGFLGARLPSFFGGVACLLFLGCRRFFATGAFFVLGAVVILPGRSGFREEAFFPLVALTARIFLDADERLLVALVIRLLIGLLA